jgi:hypothetical protein
MITNEDNTSNLLEDSIEVVNVNNIKKLFDDSFYPTYRENNDFIPKDKLLKVLIDDINTYLNENMANLQSEQSEIRLGYILCSQITLNSAKMNTMLSMLIQVINPNIRLQSYWETIASLHGPMEVSNRIEIINVHKIRIKLIIKPNDKEYAIKKLASINLDYYAKNSKKANDYLEKINMEIKSNK